MFSIKEQRTLRKRYEMKKTIHIKDQTHNPNFLTAHCMIAVRSNKNNLYRQREWGGGKGGGVKGEERGG